MKKIIVPVDFSDTAAAAVRFATYLAEVMNLDMTVLHVFDAMLSGSQSISTRAREQEQERLTAELRTFVHRNADPVLATFQGRIDTLPAIRILTEEGAAAQRILWETTGEDTALMVMGGVGAGAGLHPPGLFGGVARTVALKGSCPLILIPPDYGDPKVERLAIAFDDAEQVRQLAGFTQTIIKALRPEVHFVHVAKADWTAEADNEADFLRLSWETEFPGHAFKFDALPEGNVVDRLLHYTLREEIGLLVLGGERRSFFERLFQPGHLRPLIRQCEVPLLIIPLSP